MLAMAHDYFRMSTQPISFGRTLALLTLHSAKTTFNAFGERGLQPLESVADGCASSIENAATGVLNRRCFELRIMEEVERARRYVAGMGRHRSVQGLE